MEFPEGSILGLLLFKTYINDLPLRVNFVLELILFADVKISSRNFEDFSSVSNSVLSPMTKWFAANNLILNLDKTIMMKLITKNSAHSSIEFGHKEKYLEETMNKKFLGLQIDNHIKCKNHVKEMIPKCSMFMLLGRWSTSVSLTLSNQFTMYTSILLQNVE